MAASRDAQRVRRRQIQGVAGDDAGLRYIDDASAGIRRLRCGRGFRYVDPDGHAVRDAQTLARIRALAIPPAYREVWICASPHGHIQAIGRDARGRRQYRYHPAWRPLRDAHKFDRLVGFGKALPRLRRRLRHDLALPGLPREKAVATTVAILATTLLRVGNPEYARDNGSYGLTTLRNRHATFRGGTLRLQFQGKGGRLHEVDVEDRRLARLVRAMHELPGQRLFQYRDGDGGLQPIDSADVNAYLREAMAGDFSAKDFRTWGATTAAFRLLADIAVPDPAGERELAGIRNAVIDEVAAMLGNTAAICRKSYVDPRVFEGWQDGRLHRAAAGARGPRQWEQAALRFLGRTHRTTRRTQA
nr:DNA topoisomerase IB [Pseudoxanthomonas suwonensis]